MNYIFAVYSCTSIQLYKPYIWEETLVYRLLGNLVLNLWDCGGQEAFMENYFASQRDNIFRNVEVKIIH